MTMNIKDELALLSMLIPLDAGDWTRVRDYVDSRMQEPGRKEDARMMQSISPRRTSPAPYRTRTQEQIRADQARMDAEIAKRTRAFRVGEVAKALRITPGQAIRNLKSAKARGLVYRTGTSGPSSLWHPKGK
jgi:hypothetical protein